MKVFVLLSRIPWPLEKGDKLRAWHQLEELSKKHEIYLYCINDSAIPEGSLQQLEKICKEVHFYKLNRLLIYWHLFLGIFTRLPFQVHYFYQSKPKRQIQQLIEKIKPDHIYCQLIRTTEYVKSIHHIPKTLDYMDAFSKGIERRIKKESFFLRPIFRTEAKRLMAYESLIFDYFEKKTIITEQDRNYIYHPDQKQIAIIPNGVDTDYFKPIELEKKYDLIFHGNMSYAPNVDTAIFLANEILPVINKTHPNIKLLISGTNPLPKVLELAKDKNITVSGWIEDPRIAYASAKIFIAPLQIGTGLQNKLLEAMAMKIPCITSTLANNALKAIPGKEILIADTVEDYIKHIHTLLNDGNLAKELSENAYRLVIERFNWAASVKELERLMFE